MSVAWGKCRWLICARLAKAKALRDEKAKVLRAVRPMDLRDAVRAQYEGFGDAVGVAVLWLLRRRLT